MILVTSFLDMNDHLIIHQISIVQTDNQTEFNGMDNFALNELMELAEAYVRQLIDEIYRRLTDRDFALEDPEVVIFAGRLNKHLRA